MTTNADLDDLRALIARSCQILGRLHLTQEPLGHVSARIPGSDRFLIKARGPGEMPMSYARRDDVIEIDIEGKRLTGRDGLASPGEVYIHTWMYRTRPEVNAVVHVHPASVVLFTIVDRPLLPILGAFNAPSVRLHQQGIPTYPHAWLVNSDARGQELAKTIGGSMVCMMRSHGITAVGRDVKEATLNAITLNLLAEMNYRAALLGTPRPVPDDELEDLRPAGLSFAAAGESYTASEWTYYDRVVGP